MPIRVKKIYDKPERADGVRILVDRLWPRGLSKENAAIDEWVRDISPSPALRKWFAHKPERWAAFREKYFRELQASSMIPVLLNLRRIGRMTTVTLLYAASDNDSNNAVALASFLKKGKIGSGP